MKAASSKSTFRPPLTLMLLRLSRTPIPKVQTSTGPIKGARVVNHRSWEKHTNGNMGQHSTPAKKGAEGQEDPAIEQQLVVSALMGTYLREHSGPGLPLSPHTAGIILT